MKYIYVKNLLTKIINSLTSTETNAALSAKQGKILNEKIATIPNTPPAPPLINPSDLIVNTSLSSDDTDKAPSVHLIKESLSTKVTIDPVTNKIPNNNLPPEMVTVEQLKLIGGSKIKVTTTDDETYTISEADTKEDVINYLKELKLGDATSNQKWIDICYCGKFDNNNGLYFAIAEDTDKAMKSADGKIWEEVTLPSSSKYRAISYNHKICKMCIVSNDSNEVLISSDGVSFTKVVVPSKLNYVDVVDVNGAFVAISDNGKMIVSTDSTCTNWIEKDLPAPTNNNKYNAVCYSNRDRRIIVVGDTGSIVVSSVLDNNVSAVTFDRHDLSSANNTIKLVDVVYFDDVSKYCAIGTNTDKMFVSDDGGSTWKDVNLGKVSGWVKGIYVSDWKALFVVSESEDIGALTLDTSNLDRINLPNTSTPGKYSSMAWSTKNDRLILTVYDSKKFVSIGVDTKVLWISGKILSNNSGNTYLSVCWSPELQIFCAVCYFTANISITSADGITWRRGFFRSDSGAIDICWSPELRLFCAISGFNANGSITDKAAISSDGISWRSITLPTKNHWYSICWSPKLRKFCVVAGEHNAQCLLSSDGVNWSAYSMLNMTTSVCWSPELNIFCCINSTQSMISSNGINWTTFSLPIVISNAYSICWSPKLKLFCAVGVNNGVISSDGMHWTKITLSDSGENYRKVCWSPEAQCFCAVSKKIKISFDGVHWKEVYSLPDNSQGFGLCWSPKLNKFCCLSDYIYALGSVE